MKHLIAVAREEFEAWLIADVAAVSEVLGRPFAAPGSPERLAPRRAKELLGEALGQDHPQRSGHPALRRQIAELTALGTLERRCRAFALFAKEMRSLPL